MPTGPEPNDPPAQFVNDSLAYTDEAAAGSAIVAIPGLPGSGLRLPLARTPAGRSIPGDTDRPTGLRRLATVDVKPMTTEGPRGSVMAVIEHLGLTGRRS